jgi:hypothetical protein
LFKKNGAAMAKYVLHEVLRRNTISKARKNISAHYDLVSCTHATIKSVVHVSSINEQSTVLF